MNRRLLVTLLALCLALGILLPQPAAGQDPEEEINRAAYTRFAEEVYNGTGDLSVIDELVDENAVFHSTTGANGREVFKALWEANHAGQPDMQSADSVILAQGDRVAGWHYMTFTFNNEWLGLPPTGQTVGFNGLVLTRFKDGKIVEVWDMFDTANVMQQAGAIPGAEIAPPQEPWDVSLGESALTPVQMHELGVRHAEAVTRGDFEAGFDAVFAPELVAYAGQVGPMNLEEFKAYNAAFAGSFDNLLVATVGGVGEGNLFIGYYWLDGNFTEDLMGLGIPANGQPMRIGGMGLWRVEGDKFSGIWHMNDSLGMVMQLSAAAE